MEEKGKKASRQEFQDVKRESLTIRLIEWKAYKSGIVVTNMNPAYTSQVHHECGKFRKRNGRSFRCPHCGKEMDADVNATYDIMERKNIKEITL